MSSSSTSMVWQSEGLQHDFTEGQLVQYLLYFTGEGRSREARLQRRPLSWPHGQGPCVLQKQGRGCHQNRGRAEAFPRPSHLLRKALVPHMHPWAVKHGCLCLKRSPSNSLSFVWVGSCRKGNSWGDSGGRSWGWPEGVGCLQLLLSVASLLSP